jgi:2-keto-4-pentenoate hydratase/2-oxohepta-3-ene-1,7-dioic acid hydratase in catechol pathway
VIGRTARRVAVEDAWACVAGLTVCNDVSARDVQQRAMFGDSTVSIAGAKSFDTFKPLGPCLVTADEFSEPLDLHLRTWVNGELRQDARTTEFVYQISELISWVSQRMTLEPGDVLATGSPQGVGQFAPNGGVFLRPGDVVEIEVERIGRLRNTVAAAS